MAALSAAHQLSLTNELRAAYDVTVYTLGWRLGGKCATGRETKPNAPGGVWPGGRICEHGLHFWFGCYENAFKMLQEAYAAWHPPAGCRIRSWRDAVKPQRFTPLGAVRAGAPAYWPLTWPDFGGTPGDGAGDLGELWDLLEGLAGVLVDLIDHSAELSALVVDGRLVTPQAAGGAPSAATTASIGLGDVARTIREHIRAAAHALEHALAPEVDAIHRLLATLRDEALGIATTHPAAEVLHLGAAFVKGVLADVVLHGKTRDQLCDVDFRDWLASHGSHPNVLRSSTFLRAYYDTVMQYVDGDTARPSMAASTAIVVMTRLACTTKEAMLWEVQAGFADVIVSPLYDVLRDRGVRFEFFRRVDRLELSTDRTRIARVHLSRQVDLAVPEYQPTTFDPRIGLVCWPAEPHWDQIAGGARPGVNLESHWCTLAPVGPQVLEADIDFDHVVLAISLGAFKQLNAEPGLADELIAANPAFADMTRNIGLIPTMAMQLWCDPDTAALGWSVEKPAAVGGPEPFSVWSDMTQSLAYEPWEPGEPPRSVHYFCGTFATDLYARPSTDRTVPAQADADVRAACIGWLEREAATFLPATVGADGQVDWQFLHASPGAVGPARFDEQFRRANVDPTECCPGSFAGSTRHRLPAGRSGFTNLVLAGCWVATGLDTTCVESAVMAGMQAARAISGSPPEVWGEHFVFDDRNRKESTR